MISGLVGTRVDGSHGDLESAIGRLSSGWELVPLRQIAEVQSGLTLGRAFDEPTSEFPYLRVANVKDGHISTADLAIVEVPATLAVRHSLRRGDVLMTEGGDNDKLGRGAVWDGRVEPCLHQNHVFAVRPGTRLLPEYLSAILGSGWGRAYFTATAHQTTNLASTNRAKVGRFPVPLPPADVQRRLVEQIEALIAGSRGLADEASRQVGLLREHRQALITDAVTGGLDAARKVA